MSRRMHFFFFFSLLPTLQASSLEIATEYGIVKGFLHEEKARVFLGVPFAEPPIGDLRLQVL